MSASDKARHLGDEVKGTVKEGVGKLTDDELLEAEGKLQKTAGKVGHKADEIRDDLRHKD